MDKEIIVFMQLKKIKCFACIGSVNKVFANLPYDISAVARVRTCSPTCLRYNSLSCEGG